MSPWGEKIDGMRDITFIGVRNYPQKAQLLKQPFSSLVEIATEALVYDCERHLDFLAALEDGRDPSESLYWKYHALLGRSADGIAERCHRFTDLYRTIGIRGFDTTQGYIAVTDDGIRLNGSHRAAIAHHLGLGTLPVAIYRWETTFQLGEVQHIREEAEEKRALRARVAGLTAHDKTSGKYLGHVSFSDIIWRPRSVWRLIRWSSPQVVYAIVNDSGLADYYGAESVYLT